MDITYKNMLLSEAVLRTNPMIGYASSNEFDQALAEIEAILGHTIFIKDLSEQITDEADPNFGKFKVEYVPIMDMISKYPDMDWVTPSGVTPIAPEFEPHKAKAEIVLQTTNGEESVNWDSDSTASVWRDAFTNADVAIPIATITLVLQNHWDIVEDVEGIVVP